MLSSSLTSVVHNGHYHHSIIIKRIVYYLLIWLTIFITSSYISVQAQSICGGGTHTCALTTSGGMKCWGYNGYGQLGDNSLSTRSTPVNVVGLSKDVSMIDCGSGTTCAITTSGRMQCWGLNGEAQIGDGSRYVNKQVPVNVSGLTTGVSAAANGIYHSCALLTNGGVKCWGKTDVGQVGDGAPTGTTTTRLTPTDVTGLSSGVGAINTGSSHTCVILSSTKGMKCWGTNSYGQLGDDTTTIRNTPVDVYGLTTDVIGIALGDSHTCALTTSWGVKCWGDNSSGQLGDGTKVMKTKPVDVSGLTSGVVAIAANSMVSCAITSDGGIKCWGSGSYGKLGNGITDSSYSSTTPVSVSGITSGACEIAVGETHVCAILSSGQVKCWGLANQGQLGQGTATTGAMFGTPQLVSSFYGVTPSPTASPTFAPTASPTMSPTRFPTSQPTNQPSSQPSSQPTQDPSIQPTSKPTNQPTNQPTSEPSSYPTSQPSLQPVSRPSSQPSSQPTTYPSSQPSQQPSSKPTQQPSSKPSNQPTTQPSCLPSGQPTGLPSNQPTVQPTRLPTSQPSSKPSCQPSSQPTNQPTSIPSPQPTITPSTQPTVTPSTQPTQQPSSNPSSQPSNQPTNQPSGFPSNQPTQQPSNHPSCQPSAKPSSIPSCQPTIQPSSYPTRLPSAQPTTMPSIQPSNNPTTQPSIQPSTQPSAIPSSQPFGQPSRQPTVVPSSQPSSSPSVQPTSIPSHQPSNTPSSQPTIQPSATPSLQPSSQPSIKPSYQPTVQPTRQPSTRPSCQPSSVPSISPSTQPTRQPSIQPSLFPTSQPSMRPTSQPSMLPSTQPSTKPTRQPFSLPSSQPTRQPSSQPISMPSAQPYGCPTMQPSSQPSSSPSKQPSSQPVSSPTAKPSSTPTLQPSIQPTGQPSSSPSCQPTTHPSMQPSTVPTSSPTSIPTIDRYKCNSSAFYQPEMNRCAMCPLNSIQLDIGSLTCTCKAGFRQINSGESLSCVICPGGYFSTQGSTTCSICQAGYSSTEGSDRCTICDEGTYALEGASLCTPCATGTFASEKGQTSCVDCPIGSYASIESSSTCTLCEQGFFAAESGMTKCTQCGANMLTPGLGATSQDFCVNPQPNFMIAGGTMVGVFIALYIYLIQGRLQTIAFERKVLFVQPLAKTCFQIQRWLDKTLSVLPSSIEDEEQTTPSVSKVVCFVVVSPILFLLFSMCHYLIFFYKAFYNALFIFRGLVGVLEMTSFIGLIKSVIIDLSQRLHISPNIVGYLFYPAMALVQLIGSLSINLDQISVTCEGSKAPAELFTNCLILGIVISILLSGYQYLWLLVFPNVTISFFKSNFLLSDVLVERLHDYPFSNPLLCTIGVAVMSINPFEGIIRFLLSLASLQRFFEDNGKHRITDACNQVKFLGVMNLDGFLGMVATMTLWWLIIPFIYILSGILVPKCVLRDQEILRLTHEDLLLLKAKEPQGLTKKVLNYRHDTALLHSILPEDNIHHIDTRHEHHQQQFHMTDTMIATIKVKARKATIWMVIKRYYRKLMSYLQTLISIDIVIISLAKYWLQFLGARHGIHNVNKFDLDSSDEESSDDEDKNNKKDDNDDDDEEGEDAEVTSDSNSTNRIGQQSAGVKLPNQHETNNDNNNNNNKEIAIKLSRWSLFMSKLTLVESAARYDLYQKRLKYAKEDQYTNRSHQLSSYTELCILVTAELRHRFGVGKRFAIVLSWLGLGHLFTRVGRIHWRMVNRKYYHFFCGCLGIWTNEIYQAFEFEETTHSLFINKADTAIENYEIHRTLLYINIGMKSIIFQMIPIMTIFTVIVTTLASSPLFVTSDYLLHKLPPLIVWNAWDIAIESHLHINGLSNCQWCIYLNMITIFITKSRLFAFIANFLMLCIPFLVLDYKSALSRKLLLLALVMLFPCVCAHSLNVIVIFGRQLHITDTDLRYVYDCCMWIVTCGFGFHIPFIQNKAYVQPEETAPHIAEDCNIIDIVIPTEDGVDDGDGGLPTVDEDSSKTIPPMEAEEDGCVNGDMVNEEAKYDNDDDVERNKDMINNENEETRDSKDDSGDDDFHDDTEEFYNMIYGDDSGLPTAGYVINLMSLDVPLPHEIFQPYTMSIDNGQNEV